MPAAWVKTLPAPKKSRPVPDAVCDSSLIFSFCRGPTNTEGFAFSIKKLAAASLKMPWKRAFPSQRFALARQASRNRCENILAAPRPHAVLLQTLCWNGPNANVWPTDEILFFARWVKAAEALKKAGPLPAFTRSSGARRAYSLLIARKLTRRAWPPTILAGILAAACTHLPPCRPPLTKSCRSAPALPRTTLRTKPASASIGMKGTWTLRPWLGKSRTSLSAIRKAHLKSPKAHVGLRKPPCRISIPCAALPPSATAMVLGRSFEHNESAARQGRLCLFVCSTSPRRTRNPLSFFPRTLQVPFHGRAIFTAIYFNPAAHIPLRTGPQNCAYPRLAASHFPTTAVHPTTANVRNQEKIGPSRLPQIDQGAGLKFYTV